MRMAVVKSHAGMTAMVALATPALVLPIPPSPGPSAKFRSIEFLSRSELVLWQGANDELTGVRKELSNEERWPCQRVQQARRRARSNSWTLIRDREVSSFAGEAGRGSLLGQVRRKVTPSRSRSRRTERARARFLNRPLVARDSEGVVEVEGQDEGPKIQRQRLRAN